MNALSIHDRARDLVAQSAHMTLSEAYAELSRRAALRRRAKYGTLRLQSRSGFENIERREMRLPYRDD